MPYQWSSAKDDARHLRLSPYSALSRKGFAWFIGVTAALILLPLMSVLATPVFWGLLPFLAIALTALWIALRRSWADREITEELAIDRSRARLVRKGPGRRLQSWEANIFWVTVHLHPTGGPVPDYLTLRGDGREVELGAFLTGEERRRLWSELRSVLAQMRDPDPRLR